MTELDALHKRLKQAQENIWQPFEQLIIQRIQNLSWEDRAIALGGLVFLYHNPPEGIHLSFPEDDELVELRQHLLEITFPKMRY